jgi:hypothetical protein
VREREKEREMERMNASKFVALLGDELEDWALPADAHVTVLDDGTVNALIGGRAVHNLDGWDEEMKARVLRALDSYREESST